MEGILFPRGVVEGREGLKEYQARGGYGALGKAVKYTPEDVIKEVAATPVFEVAAARGFPPEKNGPSPENALNSHATWF